MFDICKKNKISINLIEFILGVNDFAVLFVAVVIVSGFVVAFVVLFGSLVGSVIIGDKVEKNDSFVGSCWLVIKGVSVVVDIILFFIVCVILPGFVALISFIGSAGFVGIFALTIILGFIVDIVSGSLKISFSCCRLC